MFIRKTYIYIYRIYIYTHTPLHMKIEDKFEFT